MERLRAKQNTYASKPQTDGQVRERLSHKSRGDTGSSQESKHSTKSAGLNKDMVQLDKGISRKTELIRQNPKIISMDSSTESSQIPCPVPTDPNSKCEKHSEYRVDEDHQARYYSTNENKSISYMCVDCAFTRTLNTKAINIDKKLTSNEKFKKEELENFLNRLDLFKSCLHNNVETSKRKLNESNQRFDNDVCRIKTLFEHISRLIRDVFDK